MNKLLICLATLNMAACGNPSLPTDGGLSVDAMSEPCELDVCLNGQIEGERQTFVAGWWGPTLGITEPSMTGGFTASTEVSDACEEVQSMNPPPDGWSFSFLLRDRDGDANGDRLPDPGLYPVVPGWEDEHSESVFAELLVGRAEGGVTLLDTVVTAQSGTLTLFDVERNGRIVGELDVELEGGAGEIRGSFRIDYCVPVP